MSTRRIGKSTLTSSNRLPKALLRLRQAKVRATNAMAAEAKRQADDVFATDGDGLWDKNADSTIRRKGHGIVMLESGTLAEGIEIRPSENNLANMAIGWFGDHPGSKMSMGDLAAIHEFGTDTIPARRWLSMVESNQARSGAVFDEGRKQYMRL